MPLRLSLVCFLVVIAPLIVCVPSAQAAVSVTVTPRTVSLLPSQSQAFTATVTGTSDLRVAWTVDGVPNGSPTLGTITTAGQYTAPAVRPGTSVTVKAASVPDPTKSSSSVVSLVNPVPVLTDIQPRNVNTGLTTTLRAIGSNFVSGAQLYWGTLALTTTFVSTTELRASYKPTEAAYTGVLLSVKNPGSASSGTQSVMTIPPISVLIGPQTGTLILGMRLAFGAYIGNAQDPSLRWSVNDIPGGNLTVGTIDSAGVYTTPAVLPPTTAVTIKATSVQDPRAFAAATLTLMNPVPLFVNVLPRLSNRGLATTFTLSGYRFAPGAQVYWNGQPEATVFVSDTELRITHTATEPAGSVVSLFVRNAESGGTNSMLQEVTVLAPVSALIAPATATVRLGETSPFQAGVLNSLDQSITWAVNGIPGGNATVGTISTLGVYTAPALLPTPNTIEIKAASTSVPSATAAAMVTLWNDLPVVFGTIPSQLTSTATSFAISGTGFARDATATLDGRPLQVTVVSPTLINVSGATVSPQPGGLALIQVTNPDPGGAASPVIGIPIAFPSGTLSYAAASRFLEQASWGPTPESLARVMQIGRDAWISEQFATADSTYNNSLIPMPGLSNLQAQFMRNAVHGSDQLRQRVAFALGQLFVVSGVKLDSEAQMAPYQRLLLTSAFGNFRTLMQDITLSPSMGEFLDVVNNDKPSSQTPVAANENYARELLQLFTMGTGSYTETDIKQLALVLTGWTYPPTGTLSAWPNPPNYTGPMVAFNNHHDTTAKTILGVSIPAGQTASQDLNAALNVVFNHPGVPQFVSYRLIQHLVTGNPSPAYVSRVAAAFADNGKGVRGDLQAVVRGILLDPEAATDDVSPLGADQGHLREPVLYIAGMLRALGAVVPENTSLATFAPPMGQNLFYPPTVFNYFSPSYRIPGTALAGPEFQILNGSTALARANFAIALTHGLLGTAAYLPLSRFDELAGDIPQLLDAISNALYRGQMQPDMRASITNAIAGFPDPFTRARTALFLAASHARYQAQR